MATLTRTKPWRQHGGQPAAEVQALLDKFAALRPDADDDLAAIERAYELAAAAHEGQFRKSGEPYLRHPIAVAAVVCDLGLDATSVCAALLHDTVEDTPLRIEELADELGPEVAEIVDGLTKLDRVEFGSKEAHQAASMRKLIVSLARDLRVLIIKLADRLHNMRTLAVLRPVKQQRIAQETLDIYAPLAHRLGMQEIKNELQDLAFAALYPDIYAEIDHMVAVRAPEREIYLTQVMTEIETRLAELGIEATVEGRPKHLWSIYEKMVLKDVEFSDIFDLVGIRILVDTIKDCYAALGCVHGEWKPIQGRFKDYVAMPKFNLYQSLHTTVVGPQGKSLEVQIRTQEMHALAERGVAAHYDYKFGPRGDDLEWLGRIVDWEKDTGDPDFLTTLKTDLEMEEVFVFTPKGDLIRLPVGSTPVDFAYAVHTEIGHACIGARVNGRLVPLDDQLESGETVEIFTSKVEGAGPSRDWARFVVSHRAQNKIRQWYSRERREDAMANGREELVSALRREALPTSGIAESQLLGDVATSLNYQDVDSLCAAIGEGHVAAKSVAAKVARTLRSGDQEEQLPRSIRQPAKSRRRRRAPGVHVEGLDDVMIRLARCCSPVPPDEIMGFVTKGRGVSVHRADCANALSLAAGKNERLIEVEWDEDREADFLVTLEVKALDRTRLLSQVADAVADEKVNIVGSDSRVADRISTLRFDIELADASHLSSVIQGIKAVDGVYDAYRVVPGKGR